jgi:protein TonB
MSTTINSPKVSATDRLAFTLFLSIAFNALIILGVGFQMLDPKKNEEAPLPSLEVVLVEPNGSKIKNEEADFLAQSSQEGGGNTEERNRPTTLQAAPDFPSPLEGDADTMQPRQIANDRAGQQEVLNTFKGQYQAPDQNNPDQEAASQTTAAQLMMRGQEIARLSAEIADSQAVYSKREKHRTISASTKEYRDAEYLDSWRRKVEKIGNQNYPEEAKLRHLSGMLVLDVVINYDGTVRHVDILRTSGQKLLDDAAVRTVRLASPFAPLSSDMRKDTDVLHITRTWIYESGDSSSLSTR